MVNIYIMASVANSFTNLNSNNFTGKWENVEHYASAYITINALVEGTLYVFWAHTEPNKFPEINSTNDVITQITENIKVGIKSYEYKTLSEWFRIAFAPTGPGNVTVQTVFKTFVTNFTLSDASGYNISATNGAIYTALTDVCGHVFRTTGDGSDFSASSLYTHLTDACGDSIAINTPENGAYVGKTSSHIKHYISDLTIVAAGTNYNVGDTIRWESNGSLIYFTVVTVFAAFNRRVTKIIPVIPLGSFRNFATNMVGSYGTNPQPTTAVAPSNGIGLTLKFTLSNTPFTPSNLTVGLCDSEGIPLNTSLTSSTKALYINPNDIEGRPQAFIANQNGGISFYGTLVDRLGNTLNTSLDPGTDISNSLFTKLTDITGKLISEKNPLPVISYNLDVSAYNYASGLTSNFVQLPITIPTGKTTITLTNLNLYNGYADTVWVKMYDVQFAILPTALKADLTQTANQIAGSNALNTLTPLYNIAVPAYRTRDLYLSDGIRFNNAISIRASITNNSGTAISGYDNNAVLGPTANLVYFSCSYTIT